MSGHERRRTPRQDVDFSIVCDDDEHFLLGSVLNLSYGGALVEVTEPLAMGAQLSFVPVGGATDLLFQLPAQVVRVIPNANARSYQIGLRFLAVDGEGRAGLEMLMAQMLPNRLVRRPAANEVEAVPRRRTASSARVQAQMHRRRRSG